MSFCLRILCAIAAAFVFPLGAAPAPPPVVSGSTGADFEVTSSGGASYRIPLQVPPGTNGLEPELALAYQSGAGNGIAGLGFTVEGLSAITRTGMQLLVDGKKGGVNYDADDRFALDGMRLININSVAGGYGGAGAVYRTQQESWKRIVANGTCGSGPCSFTVTLPDGTVRRYTAAAPASGPRFAAGMPRAGSVRAWFLSSVTDLNGNSMSISYAAAPPQLGGGSVGGSTGMLYPSIISYTANTAAGLVARRSVQFFYTSRPDLMQTSLGGAEVTAAALLAHVRTYLVPADVQVLVKDYALAYSQGPTGRSRLASVTECDGRGSCVRPTTFDWSNGPSSFVASKVTVPNIGSNAGWIGDFNGDGRTDLLSKPAFVSCLATGTGFQCGGPLNLQLGSSSFVADFNGDGRADFLSGGGDEANVYYSTSAGIGATATAVTTPYFSDQTFASDFNGDGLADLFSGSSSDGYLALATPSGFGKAIGPIYLDIGQGKTYAADFNGDGMSDLFSAGCNNGSLYLSTGAGFTPAIAVTGLQLCQDSVFVSDFNGDALPDLLSASGATAYIAHGNGAGFDAASPVTGLNVAAGMTWPADYNADGRTDLYVSAGSGGTIYYSVDPSPASALFTAVKVAGQNLSATSAWLGDFNGDGLADFYNSDASVSTMWLGGPVAQMPDFITSIVTGAGGRTSIAYKPMTDTSVYSPSPDGSAEGLEPLQLAGQYAYAPLSPVQVSLYPIAPARGALYLVSSYALANEPSINAQPYAYSYGFRYAAALVNLAGRGWLGFRTRTRLDPQLDARVTVTYDQIFPYNTQMLSRAACGNASSAAACTSSDPQFLEQTTIARSCVDTIANAPCVAAVGAYSASATQVFQVLRDRESNAHAQWQSTATTSFSYDPFGNATAVTHTGSGPQSTLYRCRSFHNDTNAWRIGFVAEEKDSSAAGCPQAWDTYAFTGADLSWTRTHYDSRMNVDGRASWDSANQQFLGNQYAVDAFGNTTSTSTVTFALGAKPATVPNTTAVTTVEETYRTFPATSTTPLANPAVATSALNTATLYDPRFGTLVATQDENGLVRTTCLDGFGRTIGEQGPPPAGTAAETNCLSAAGAFAVPPAFAKAPVVTLSATTFSPSSSTTVSEQTATRTDWATTSGAAVTTVVLDGLERIVETAESSATPGVNVVHRTVWLDESRIAKSSLPYFSNASPQWQTYTYNGAGHRTAETVPFASASGSTRTTTRTYCAGNVVITTVNPSAAVTCGARTPASYATQTIATYDRFLHGPRPVSQSQTADQGALTSFTRDPLGRLLTILAPASRVNGSRVATSAAYDSLGRMKTQSVTGVMQQQYFYDSIGRLDHQIDGAGQKLAFTYDGLGRTLSRSAYSSAGKLVRTASFTYDTTADPAKYAYVLGRIATATTTDNANGNATVVGYAWGYDASGNPAVTTTALGGAAYDVLRSWNARNEPSTLTYPNGAQLVNGHAAGNLLTSISLAPAGGKATTYLTASGFDAAGQPATLAFGNGARETFTYTPQETLLTHEVFDGGGTSSLASRYSWDALGNPLSDGSSTFGYTADRLTSASGPAGTFTYSYDANGNMLEANGATLTYASYQMVRGTNGFQAVYDAAGNMTSRTPPGSADTWTQTFDPDGNLTALSLNGTPRRAFQYDDNGRLVAAIAYAADGKTVASTTYSVAPYYEVTTTPEGTSATMFLDDAGGHRVAVSAAGSRYFHRDQVDSTVRITGGDGAVAASVAYEPYGRPQAPSAIPGDPLFNGRPYDAGTGLMDFDTRAYDPFSGVFASADSIVSGPPTRQDTPHRYAFVWNAPASRSDPTGRGPVDDLLFLAEATTEAIEGTEEVADAAETARAGGAATATAADASTSAGTVVLTTAAPADDGLAAYGGSEKFKKLTGRPSWRKTKIQKMIAKARKREKSAREFTCPTCSRKLTGEKLPGATTRDFDTDHTGATHADRVALLRTAGLRKFGGLTLTRKQFIELYHWDLRPQCAPCNRSHRHEPKESEAEIAAMIYATELWPERFGAF